MASPEKELTAKGREGRGGVKGGIWILGPKQQADKLAGKARP